ncbi:winged helix-turn-helix transcriptional regulator [Nocardia sp. NPDC050193]
MGVAGIFAARSRSAWAEPDPGSQTLRRLQQYGLVERPAEAPRRVVYSLTDLGRTLVEPIEVRTDWARDHGEAIVDFQESARTATSDRAPRAS